MPKIVISLVQKKLNYAKLKMEEQGRSQWALISQNLYWNSELFAHKVFKKSLIEKKIIIIGEKFHIKMFAFIKC